tara:strand:- start:5462 stop:5845 length:384 start_codon:yes stop_codon:yes gene_type:complete
MLQYFGAPKKKMFTFTSGKKKVRARTPASAARKVYKQMPGYKSKGAKVISVKNNKGKVFRYNVKLIKINKTVEIEGKSITYKYKIKVKAIGKKKNASKTKSSTKTKSKSSTKTKTRRTIKPTSGGWY